MASLDYNLGRVVYVTLQAETLGDPKAPADRNHPKAITLVYDPMQNINFCSRIDFWMRAVNADSLSNGYTICTIDLYNVGPAIKQFLNAYNEYDDKGFWKADRITKYKVALAVGYHGRPQYTIFSGWIGSFNVERIQTEKAVDNVWHLYAQNPSVLPLTIDESITPTDTQTQESAIAQAQKTYSSGNEYLRDVIMNYPERQVYEFEQTLRLDSVSSWEVKPDESNLEQTMVGLPQMRKITPANFDRYYEIRYVKAKDYATPDPLLKQEWTNAPFHTLVLDYGDLARSLNDVAAIRNCHADIVPDPAQAKIFIYIYRAGQYVDSADNRGGRNWPVVNFKNLHKPPVVSAGMITFDFIMEPAMRNMDTIELLLDDKWGTKVPSFGISFNESETPTTQSAGANFAGVFNVANSERSAAMKDYGNIFGQKYLVMFLEHSGSTHTNQWSTKVDCTAPNQPKDVK